MLRKMCCDQAVVRPVTPSEYLCEHPSHQLLMPGASTWGKNSTFEPWRLEQRARVSAERVDVPAHVPRDRGHGDARDRSTKTRKELRKRALNQAARETILAQASDWPFLISMGQSIRYAEVRLIKHISRARELIRQIQCGTVLTRDLSANARSPPTPCSSMINGFPRFQQTI